MTATARRTYRSYRVPQVACFGPAVGLPLWGWDYLGRPFAVPGYAWAHAAGLGVMIAAGLLVIPGVFVALTCFAPDLPKMLVPRGWRAAYRNGRKNSRWFYQSRDQQKSSVISTRLRYLVLAADRTCVGCRAALATDVDHRVPWAWGGLTILLNCFGLCMTCNEVIKVDYWEDWRGRAHFGQHFNKRYRRQARVIFRRESRRRWSPWRMMRIAWAVGR
jgi:hypothetical protein